MNSWTSAHVQQPVVPTPHLDALADALALGWHESRCAGRVLRHVEILRGVVHEISSAPERPDRPANGDDAHARLRAHLEKLKAETPRSGLGAATAAFVDHVVNVSERWGRNLFHCFDDPRIPPSSNQLEKFFGVSKHLVRQITGNSSTSNSLVQNLGESFLLTMFQVSHAPLALDEASLDLEAHSSARAALAREEAPARRRRSLVRYPAQHVDGLLARWAATLDRHR